MEICPGFVFASSLVAESKRTALNAGNCCDVRSPPASQPRRAKMCAEVGGDIELDGTDVETPLRDEITKRRNLAIISHPDAGKTTLTEKLLLHGGAIQQAGSVRARRAGHQLARSDWMKMEQERGISITSTVLTFNYEDHHINILDTPGHQDFSEDTYRTLAAADNVVMLVDAAKGLEPQTRKLFEVCQMRELPTLTFINKMDRPAMNPFELCDEIEQQFDLETVPAVWPIGDGENFKGVWLKRSRVWTLLTRHSPLWALRRSSCLISDYLLLVLLLSTSCRRA
mmetsp:Transcript_13923/g.20203  ORF Transcript_13923/g.20203 Transcript_13923/m.20203 type:complete len:284 (+) Transcript_13923:133-984(+)